MTPESLDTELLQQIICDAFNEVPPEDQIDTPEVLLAKSSLILLWSLHPGVPQKALDLVLSQVILNIGYLYEIGLVPLSDLEQAEELIFGTDSKEIISQAEKQTFEEIVKYLQ